MATARTQAKGGDNVSVYKEPNTNTWRVVYRYTDWTGKRRQTQKRGFATRREALAWEAEQLRAKDSDLDMTLKIV